MIRVSIKRYKAGCMISDKEINTLRIEWRSLSGVLMRSTQTGVTYVD